MATPTRIAAETLATRLREENECARPSELAVALAMILGADENEVKFHELRQAARALLDALPSDMSTCPICRANVIATKVCRLNTTAGAHTSGAWFACDDHALPGSEDKRSAAPLRALRAALKEEP